MASRMKNRFGATAVWNGKRIKALRDRYGETQEQFCLRLRVPVGTLRWWEQDHGEPPGPATVVFDDLAERAPTAAIIKAG